MVDTVIKNGLLPIPVNTIEECNIYINNQGNLGIGITNPLNNLHIISDNQFPFKISSKSCLFMMQLLFNDLL